MLEFFLKKKKHILINCGIGVAYSIAVSGLISEDHSLYYPQLFVSKLGGSFNPLERLAKHLWLWVDSHEPSQIHLLVSPYVT